jgi:hypothetical protein
MRFINAKLGNSLLDFEFNVDFDDGFHAWHRNRVIGQVGELPANRNYNLSMQWETGRAVVQKVEATHCSYDNQTCYESRSVPVIFNTSSAIGYKTGGMNLTVTGYGFAEGNITATVDGQDCAVISQFKTSFSCLISPRENVSVTENTPTVGSHGIVRNFINRTNSGHLIWDHMENYPAEK